MSKPLVSNKFWENFLKSFTGLYQFNKWYKIEFYFMKPDKKGLYITELSLKEMSN